MSVAEVSPVRLLIMRAMYLLMAVGIGATIWPMIVSHPANTAHMAGVAWALLATIGLGALLGLRYPLQMIPVLLIELTWKIIWLTAFALPSWLDGHLTDAMRTSVFETSLAAILLFAIPWRYVVLKYVKQPSDPWMATSAKVAPAVAPGRSQEALKTKP